MGLEKRATNSMASNVDSVADKKNNSGNGELICENSHSIKK